MKIKFKDGKLIIQPETEFESQIMESYWGETILKDANCLEEKIKTFVVMPKKEDVGK